jgi:hypothetical protein
MKTVDDLLQELKSLQVNKKCYDGSYYQKEVVDSDGFSLAENVIREFLLDNHDSEIGEMQGKIFAYEEIIKKSNFAPFVDNSELKENVVRLQNAITNYDIEKVKKSLEETKETTEKETMFYSEFIKSDDWKQADYVEYFDLSGNVVEVHKDSDKILKFYKREFGAIVLLIVFIGKE